VALPAVRRACSWRFGHSRIARAEVEPLAHGARLVLTPVEPTALTTLRDRVAQTALRLRAEDYFPGSP
jgi:hypothetical protein